MPILDTHSDNTKGRKNVNGLQRVKTILGLKLQKGFPISGRSPHRDSVEDYSSEEILVSKKGHFAVTAVENNCKEKRFMVPLRLLNHEPFLSLLNQAAEEFGFDHEGVLRVPCCWRKMEEILGGCSERRA